jgi:gamma-butyrobetaine dioxygenase
MATQTPDYLEIDLSAERTGRYHWVWLRDSCSCGACMNSYAKQKYFDSASIPVDIRPKSVVRHGGEIEIVWEDDHSSRYSVSWLARHDELRALPAEGRPVERGRRWTPWADACVVTEETFRYVDVVDDDVTLYRLLNWLFQYGIVVIDGRDEKHADPNQLCDRLAGFVDRSYFGDYFDLEVKPEEQTDSVSFSTRPLPLHTDIPYYSTPPDFQFLYGLTVNSVATGVRAGRTRFVDGLAVAHRLREADPAAFALLTDTKVMYRAEYPAAAKTYQSDTTIIKVDRDGNVVRLANNPSKMFFDQVHFDAMADLYRAYGTFKRIMSEDGRSYFHTWSQGDMVVFDNRRIFHGREGFAGPGVTRTLRGGYFSEVELLARATFLSARRG